MKARSLIFPLLFSAAASLSAGEGKHLFILSGQSNMAGLKPELSFTPAVEKKFGNENVIIVHDAQGGQPIRRWYRDWKPADRADLKPERKAKENTKPQSNGDLYDRLIGKVNAAVQGKEIATVTFLWMQGENDAKTGNGAVYKDSLKGLVKQLSDDLKRPDVNVVIGRLSDHGLTHPGFKDWDLIRKAQVKFAEEATKGAWVDTDDLNDGIKRGDKEIKDDLHYSKEGYLTFGRRLAEAAINLIGK